MPEPEEADNKPQTQGEAERPVAGDSSPPPRGWWLLYGFGALLCVLLLIPIVLRAPMRFAGEFTKRYALNAQWSGVLVPIGVAGLMVVLICGALAQSREWADAQNRRLSVAMLVSLIVALGFILHFSSVAFLGEFSLAEASWPFLQRLGDGAYNRAASEIEDLGPFLREFQARFLESERDPLLPHMETHPPGFTLAFYALQMLFDSLPALRHGVEALATGTSPILRDTLAEAAAGSRLFRHGLSVSFGAALVCFLMAALAPAAAYLLSREFTGRMTAFLIAGACALFPGTYCYSPGLDLCLALPALLMCLCAVRAIRRRCAGWGVGAGLLAFAGLGSTLAFLVPLGMLFASGLLAWAEAASRVGSWLPRDRKAMRRYVAPCLGAVAGFIVPVVLFALLYGANLFSILFLCYRNNAEWHQGIGNRYLPWAFSNLVEATYSMGAPAAFGLAAVVLWGLARRWPRRMFGEGMAFCWGVHSIFFLLCALAVNRGEVARIWLFLFPMLWAASGPLLEPLTKRLAEGTGRRWALVALGLLLALQVAYVIVLNTSVDPLETAKTFHNVLYKMGGG